MESITEDYVSFEIAKLLKEKGFNGQYHMYYVEDGKYTCDDLHDIKDYARSVAQFDYLHKTKVPAPTLQMAMKWLREEKKTSIIIEFDVTKRGYCPYVHQLDYDMDWVVKWRINIPMKYEEAVEAAIQYSLENLI